MESSPAGQLNHKGSNPWLKWLILAVLFVIVVAGVIYALARNTSTTNSNTNTVANTNSSVDTSQWATYESSTSSITGFRDLKPSYKVSFPRNWIVDEGLGGLHLSETVQVDFLPSINISWVSQKLAGDLFEQCKKYHGLGSPDTPVPNIIKYDIQRSLKVDGRNSVLVSYHLESDNQGNTADSTIVCVPTVDKTMIVQAQSRLSTMVTDNFDAILASIDIAE